MWSSPKTSKISLSGVETEPFLETLTMLAFSRPFLIVQARFQLLEAWEDAVSHMQGGPLAQFGPVTVHAPDGSSGCCGSSGENAFLYFSTT